MTKYFFHNGRVQLGPFSIEQLRMIDIARHTPIWNEGLKAWISAEQVDELRSLFSSQPILMSEPVIQSSAYVIGKSLRRRLAFLQFW